MTEPKWLNELPPGWCCQKLGYLAEVSNSNVDKKTYEDGLPVLLCNYTDVYYNEYIRDDMEFMRSTASPSEMRRFSLRPGDVIITKDSEAWDDIAVPACVAEELGDVVCGYHLTMLRPRPGVMEGRYLLRALQASGVKEQLWVAATGITRYGLGQQAMKDALLPLPPLPTQIAIAGFLDRKTAAIDALIEKKQRLLELLAEKLAALIYRAVTQGLDPNVPMKDSGIPWIGKIPAAWTLMQIKRFARPGRKTFTDGDWIETPYITDDGVRLIQTGNVGIGSYREKGFRYVSEKTFAALRCTEVEPGDVLVCRLDGPVGRACLAPSLDVRMITSVDNAILKTDPIHDARYLVYAMNLPERLRWLQTLSQVGGGHRWRVSRSALGELRLPCPPSVEQRQIANELDALSAAIEGVELPTRRQLERLHEYRQALITAAVTGKLPIGVPEEIAP